MKKREMMDLLGYVFEGEPENQARSCLAVALHRTGASTEGTVNELDGSFYDAVKENLEKVLEHDGIEAGVKLAMQYAPKAFVKGA